MPGFLRRCRDAAVDRWRRSRKRLGRLVAYHGRPYCLDCTSFTIAPDAEDAALYDADFLADMEMEVKRMSLQRLFRHTMGLLRMVSKPDKYADDRVPLGIAVKVCKAEWNRRGLPKFFAAAEGMAAHR